MKIIKGFSIFSVLITFIILGSCVNEPEFPIVPEISIEDVSFVVTPKVEDADTLFLKLNFKDGDGDLGLPPNNLIFISTPYNNFNFFLENGGPVQALGTTTTYLDANSLKIISPIIDVPDNAIGKLVTLNTRNKEAYDTLPDFVFPFTRTAYYYDTIYVREEDKEIFVDATPAITPVDTLDGDGNTYFGLLEKTYFMPNPNYNNIDVTFQIKQSNGTYIPFDWTKTDAVIAPFNDRFPVLSDSKNPLEGTLTYAMSYTGFLDDFNGLIVRLKIQIKDRALHKSNIVYTEDFELRN